MSDSEGICVVCLSDPRSSLWKLSYDFSLAVPRQRSYFWRGQVTCAVSISPSPCTSDIDALCYKVPDVADRLDGRMVLKVNCLCLYNVRLVKTFVSVMTFYTSCLHVTSYSFLYIVKEDKHPNVMPDLWQEAMDHAVALARKAGEVSQFVVLVSVFFLF